MADKNGHVVEEPLAVAIAPDENVGLHDAVVAGGGHRVDADEAALLIWTAPEDSSGLSETLMTSRASWVQVTSAGVDTFDEAGLLDGSRTWMSAKGLYGPACAEHVIALSLSAMRRLHVHARTGSQVTVCPEEGERQLRGRTVVIVGTGGIGSHSARLFTAFGARPVGISRTGRQVEHFERVTTMAELDVLLPLADILVLCAPTTDETRGLLDERRLRMLPAGAWLVNVGRGALVDTAALTRAVATGVIGGACLDVTDPEPLPPDHPLRHLDNVLLTPHVAVTSAMASELLRERVRRNVERIARGRTPEGLVDQRAAY